MEDTDIAIDLENHSAGVETASSSVSTDLDNPSNRKGHETETKKSNVSSDLLKRFKAIEKRTDEVTKRSREKRVKYLQKSLKEKVDREITLPEDRDILRKYDVKFGPPVDSTSRKRTLTDTELTNDSKIADTSSNWNEINQYLGVNDHLKGIDRGKAAPKSGLEETIDEAITLGEFNMAEKLSDRLATREFGKKIADAFTAKDFVEKRKLEECSKRKKKKLPWGSPGLSDQERLKNSPFTIDHCDMQITSALELLSLDRFEQKHRWETKSNM